MHNLEERAKPEVMREALEAVFSEFGTIIDIIAKTNLKAKGQAFIVYDDPTAAQTAIREAQGFPLFEKPMVLALARTRSDATVRQTGDDSEFEVHKRRRIAERGSYHDRKDRRPGDGRAADQTDKKKAIEAAEEQKRQRQRAAAGGSAAPGGAAPAVVPDEYLPPNKTLFVQNLPEECDAETLTEIFSQFEGFREVRLVPGRRLAFVEYEAEPGAITAKENTAGMLLGDGEKRPMKVTYQRQ